MKYIVYLETSLVIIQIILCICVIFIPLPEYLYFSLWSIISWFILGIILGIFIAIRFIDEV